MNEPRLLTAADVADALQISEYEVKRRTKQDGWPCVRFSRKTIRYTSDDLAEIVRRHRRDAAPEPAPGLPGQTARSRAAAAN